MNALAVFGKVRKYKILQKLLSACEITLLGSFLVMKSVDLLSNQYDALRANSVNGIDIVAMQRETISYTDTFLTE